MVDHPLRKINVWLTKRLAAASTATSSNLGPLPPASRESSTSALQADFVDEQLRLIRGKLKVGRDAVKLLTLRSSYQVKTQYLRPVSSEPVQLGDIMADWRDQKPFKIAMDGAHDSFEDADDRDNEQERAGFGISWGLFDLRKVLATKIAEPAPDAPAKIALRIRSILNRLKNGGDEDLAARARELCEGGGQSQCLVFAKIEEQQPGDFRILHLLAIYLKHPKVAVTPAQVRKLAPIAANLFAGLTLIRNIDSSLFRSDTARTVVQLTREFDRQDVAPADKISFAVENIRRLLELYMVGRPLAAHHQSSGDLERRSDTLSVFYVNISFRERAEKFMPHLEIYPHVYRAQHPTSAFLMAHERVPTISKLLLHNYLSDDSVRVISNAEYSRAQKAKTEPETISVHHAFGDLFRGAEMEEALNPDSNLHATIFKSPDQLHLTARQGDDPSVLWDKLNLRVDPAALPNQSIVAFVVEGNRIPTAERGGSRSTVRLPRGIIAIESTHIDAFSDEDIDNLRELAAGLATLVRRVGHDNGTMDYETRMRTGFKRYRSDSLGNVTLADFLYEIMRLDATLLETICGDLKKRTNFRNPEVLEAQIGFSLADGGEIFDRHSEILAPIADALVNTEPRYEAGNLLKDRQTRFDERIGRLRSFYEKFPDWKQLRDFFAACPSNMAWAGYLTSVATAIGERALEQMPDLTPIAPGFSADAIFMASVKNELRQVVKFSTADKLLRERENYRRFVRYRLPFSGRIPVTSFAFDSTGSVGLRSAQRLDVAWGIDIRPPSGTADAGKSKPFPYERQCFGALVSDLVEGGHGQEKIMTLQDIVAAELHGSPTQGGGEGGGNPAERLAAHLEGLTHHFGIGTHLWRLSAGEEISKWKEEFQTAAGSDYPATVELALIFLRFRQRDQEESSSKPLFPHLLKGEVADELAQVMLTVGRETLSTLHPDLQESYGARQELQPFAEATKLSEILNALDLAVRQDTSSHPDLKFSIADIPAERFATISHGDLNPNNLAWAGAFGRFFAIDFENTGHGFVGTDHLKLMISTLVGTLEKSASLFEQRSTQRAKTLMRSVVDELMAGLRIVDVAADAIASNSIDEHSYSEFMKDMSSRFAMGSVFATLLRELSSSLDSQEEARNRGRGLGRTIDTETWLPLNHLQSENRHLFGYLLLATACKEWQYSLRVLRESTAQLIVDKLEGQTVDLRAALLTLLGTINYGNSKDLGQKRQVLDACRFLLSWCAVLATIPASFGTATGETDAALQ